MKFTKLVKADSVENSVEQGYETYSRILQKDIESLETIISNAKQFLVGSKDTLEHIKDYDYPMGKDLKRLIDWSNQLEAIAHKFNNEFFQP